MLIVSVTNHKENIMREVAVADSNDDAVVADSTVVDGIALIRAEQLEMGTLAREAADRRASFNNRLEELFRATRILEIFDQIKHMLVPAVIDRISDDPSHTPPLAPSVVLATRAALILPTSLKLHESVAQVGQIGRNWVRWAVDATDKGRVQYSFTNSVAHDGGRETYPCTQLNSMRLRESFVRYMARLLPSIESITDEKPQ